jgi:hypothetical protein
MREQNMTVQYCSATARHFLQSAKYNNVTTIRTSMDRFDRARWTHFLYASRLASAAGVWPFTDVFMSNETGNLVLATLSAGPVGLGDRVGELNGENLRRAARADGVIVKPDAPLTPLDSSFWNDSQDQQAPMIAATYTDFGDLKAWYIFLYTQGGATQARFRLAEAGLTQPAFLYDYASKTGRVTEPDELLTADATGYRYLVAVPVGPSGIGLLGDTGHFVTLGKKRIPALADDGAIHVKVAFAAGESVRKLEGYSPHQPEVTADDGTAGRLSYDSASKMFSVRVSPGRDGTASVSIRRGAAAQNHRMPGLR